MQVGDLVKYEIPSHEESLGKIVKVNIGTNPWQMDIIEIYSFSKKRNFLASVFSIREVNPDTVYKGFRKNENKLKSLFCSGKFPVREWSEAPENKFSWFKTGKHHANERTIVTSDIGYFVFESLEEAEEYAKETAVLFKSEFVVYECEAYERLDNFEGQPTYKYIKPIQQVYPYTLAEEGNEVTVEYDWGDEDNSPTAIGYLLSEHERKAKIEVLEEILQSFKECKKIYLSYNDPIKAMIMHYYHELAFLLKDKLKKLKEGE
jgi:hypothetical protein